MCAPPSVGSFTSLPCNCTVYDVCLTHTHHAGTSHLLLHLCDRPCFPPLLLQFVQYTTQSGHNRYKFKPELTAKQVRRRCLTSGC